MNKKLQIGVMGSAADLSCDDPIEETLLKQSQLDREMVNKLSKSKKEELDILAGIYATEFSKPPYNEKWSMEKATGKMEFYKKFYDLYTISQDEEIVGFVVVNPNFMCPGEVVFGEELAIKEEFQNQGIGSWTINRLFEIYKKKGYKTFLGIADVESKAYKLYQKIGLLPSKKNVLVEKVLK